MRSQCRFLATAAAGLRCATAIDLNVNSTDSVRNASSTIAWDLMSWYQNNQTDTPAVNIGTLPAPAYWWEAGAVWGGMVDYWSYTNDTSYNPTTTQGLLAQVGPDNNYMPPAYDASLGNDDQAFWGMAVLSAMEYEFAVPAENASTLWYDLAAAVFNTQWPRWDNSSCMGGLRWQIFEYNAGYNYKNSISNGAFFQIAARLGRYTGNQTYVDWAERAWDWMSTIGLIDDTYLVYDGTDSSNNCSEQNRVVWTYNPGVLLYGAAMMYNYTNGSQTWETRTTGLMNAIQSSFFSPYSNATDIMYESACEPVDTCNYDQFSFKAYLSRWMAKSSIVAPYITGNVTTLLTSTALAVAKSCSGGQNGTTCGQKWYVGGYDGNYGVGQELSALETVQALLLLQSGKSPITSKDVHVEPAVTSSAAPTPTGVTQTSPSGGSAALRVDGKVGMLCAAVAVGVPAVMARLVA